jgi:cytochrome P450
MERQGLSWIDGDDWKKKRKMVSSAFNFDFMNNFFKSLYRLTRQKFDDLAQTSNKASLTDFDLVSFSTVIAGENVSAFFYGEKHARMEVDGMLLTDLTVKLQQQFGSYHPSFWHQFVGPWFSKLKLTKLHREMMNNMELITEKGQRIIRALRESKDLDETSYLGVALKDGNMTDKELLDDFILTFMAGTDATAVSAARCMYYLWKHPECLAKVKKEVEEVFGDFKEESVKLESLKQMDYTLAFIKETLRMASPVAYFFPRECKKDTQIGDLKIHKGTLVTTPLNLTHQNADVFANPKEFIPERWMPDSEFAKKNTKINPNLYLPFGVGHRVCPGRQFSYVQLKMMIAFFIERFEWQFPENVREKMTWDVNFNYEPLEGYFPTLTKKK